LAPPIFFLTTQVTSHRHLDTRVHLSKPASRTSRVAHYSVMLYETRATLYQTRATLQETPATVQEIRATLHETPGTLYGTTAMLHETRATLQDCTNSVPIVKNSQTAKMTIGVLIVTCLHKSPPNTLSPRPCPLPPSPSPSACAEYTKPLLVSG